MNKKIKDNKLRYKVRRNKYLFHRIKNNDENYIPSQYRPLPPQLTHNARERERFLKNTAGVSLPKQYEVPRISPVKDIGLDCDNPYWAFCAVSMTEQLHGFKDLSEKELLECAPNIDGSTDNGCYGNEIYDGLSYIKNQGIIPEASFPYNGHDRDDCSDKSNAPPYRVYVDRLDDRIIWGIVDGYGYIQCLKRLIMEHGEVCVRFYPPHDFSFYSYAGGVYESIYDSETYNEMSPRRINVVGWDDDKGDDGAFKAKHCWGKKWGEDGFFWISYKETMDMKRTRFGSYPVVTAGGRVEWTDLRAPRLEAALLNSSTLFCSDTVRLTATVFAASQNKIRARLDWGDGSPEIITDYSDSTCYGTFKKEFPNKGEYVIRVRGENEEGLFTHWETFHVDIQEHRSLTLLYPEGGEIFSGYDSCAICFKKTGRFFSLDFFISQDLGKTWHYLVYDQSMLSPAIKEIGDETYEFKTHLFNFNSNQCMIKISLTDYPEIADSSRAPFTITGVNEPPYVILRCLDNGYPFFRANEEIHFEVLVQDDEEDSIQYQIDWGDGSLSPWSEMTPRDTLKKITHTYSQEGYYFIYAHGKNPGEEISPWFKIKQFPVLSDTLAYPYSPSLSKNDTLYGDNALEIVLLTFNVSDSFHIHLCKGEFYDQSLLVDSLILSKERNGDTLRYLWRTPAIFEPDCRLKLVNHDNRRVSAQYENSFRVITPTLQLLQPKGGEKWIIFSNNLPDDFPNDKNNRKIKWKAENYNGSISIEYSDDGGKNFHHYTDWPSHLNLLSFTKNVTPSDSFLIRINAKKASFVTDVCDSVFQMRNHRFDFHCNLAKHQFLTPKDTARVWWDYEGYIDSVALILSLADSVNEVLGPFPADTPEVTFNVTDPENKHAYFSLYYKYYERNNVSSKWVSNYFLSQSRKLKFLKPREEKVLIYGQDSLNIEFENKTPFSAFLYLKCQGETIDSTFIYGENKLTWYPPDMDRKNCRLHIVSTSDSIQSDSCPPLIISRPLEFSKINMDKAIYAVEDSATLSWTTQGYQPMVDILYKQTETSYESPLYYIENARLVADSVINVDSFQMKLDTSDSEKAIFFVRNTRYPEIYTRSDFIKLHKHEYPAPKLETQFEEQYNDSIILNEYPAIVVNKKPVSHGDQYDFFWDAENATIINSSPYHAKIRFLKTGKHRVKCHYTRLGINSDTGFIDLNVYDNLTRRILNPSKDTTLDKGRLGTSITILREKFNRPLCDYLPCCSSVYHDSIDHDSYYTTFEYKRYTTDTVFFWYRYGDSLKYNTIKDKRVISVPAPETTPEIPKVITPGHVGYVDSVYRFGFFATDLNKDSLYYQVIFSKDTSQWLGPFEYGDTLFINKCWHTPWLIKIGARAKDATGRGTFFSPLIDFDIRKNVSIKESLKNKKGIGYGHYPNPFSERLFINLFLPKGRNVTVEIFNCLGEKTSTLQNGFLSSGLHQFSWSGKNQGSPCPSGIYFYHIKAGDITINSKILLLR